MEKENQEKFQCPECESKNIRFRFKVSTKDKNNPYANVTEEIQCASCFMDIPANVFIFKNANDIEDNKKIWQSFYKPEHLKDAAQCSKCSQYYWQIEKQLSDINITSPDIFYQTYDTKGSGGKMVCRLCDPEAFKNNKQ